METSESQGKPPMTTVVALRPDTTGHNLLVKVGTQSDGMQVVLRSIDLI